jgi:hypothetical protein
MPSFGDARPPLTGQTVGVNRPVLVAAEFATTANV